MERRARRKARDRMFAPMRRMSEQEIVGAIPIVESALRAALTSASMKWRSLPPLTVEEWVANPKTSAELAEEVRASWRRLKGMLEEAAPFYDPLAQ